MSDAAQKPGSAALREPWEDIDRQRAAAVTGIWLFSASELLFFGGIFAGYAVYSYWWPAGFQAGGAHTDLFYGVANTLILLVSSALAAIASKAARWPSLGNFSRLCLWLTAALGVAFLVTKGMEYRHDIAENLVPGPRFALAEKGAEVFFGFYWALTGLHAIHLTIGIVLIARIAIAGRRDPAWFASSPAVKVTALYWGFVDVIWTIVFVLIYLPGRA